jgi:hypothetical protein
MLLKLITNRFECKTVTHYFKEEKTPRAPLNADSNP